MAKETQAKPATADDVEVEFKRLQILEMQERLAERNDKRERLTAQRANQVRDLGNAQRERLRIQSVCKHRKGGKDNRFARGTAPEYSIILNTYPTGLMCFVCTRCGKEVWKPMPALKKRSLNSYEAAVVVYMGERLGITIETPDLKLYEAMYAEWKQWADYTTDNSPSGSKIFEIQAA